MTLPASDKATRASACTPEAELRAGVPLTKAGGVWSRVCTKNRVAAGALQGVSLFSAAFEVLGPTLARQARRPLCCCCCCSCALARVWQNEVVPSCVHMVTCVLAEAGLLPGTRCKGRKHAWQQTQDRSHSPPVVQPVSHMQSATLGSVSAMLVKAWAHRFGVGWRRSCCRMYRL